MSFGEEVVWPIGVGASRRQISASPKSIVFFSSRFVRAIVCVVSAASGDFTYGACYRRIESGSGEWIEHAYGAGVVGSVESLAIG